MARVHGVGSSGSSIIGYIVVGIILAAVVVGAVFVSKHQVAQWFSSDGTKTVATTDKEDSATISGPISSSGENGEDNNKSKANSGSSPVSNKNNDASHPAKETDSSKNNLGTSKSQANTDSLPSTGPGSAASNAVIFSVITVALGYFVQSKRQSAML